MARKSLWTTATFRPATMSNILQLILYYDMSLYDNGTDQSFTDNVQVSFTTDMYLLRGQ